MRKPCFSGYSKDRKDDMISAALFMCIKRLPNYNPGYIAKPFSYFTKTIYRVIIQKIKEYKKRDKVMKSISYVENFENNTFKKSSLLKDEESVCLNTEETDWEWSDKAKRKYLINKNHKVVAGPHPAK
jgi:hypothetical protein